MPSMKRWKVMNNTQKILIARNELENVMSNLQKQFQLSEGEAMIVLELALATSRYRAIAQDAYDQVEKARKEQDNGNTNEKGQ